MSVNNMKDMMDLLSMEDNGVTMICKCCGKKVSVCLDGSIQKTKKECNEMEFYPSEVKTIAFGICGFCKSKDL
ncbi:MAG: hypothetical protein OIF32_04245 [Campylobacterales bacterium]|nr:hypothetical protein [Campylobacterales bacterium]